MRVLTETLVAPLALAVNSSCWTISTENLAGPPPEADADELAVVVVVHWILAAGGPSPVAELDPEGKRVVTTSGKAVPYDYLIVATGLALSPTWDAIVPWWTDLFGGRQFARTWHFVAMILFFSFIIAHVSLVLLSGPTTWAKMVTGGVAPKDVKHEA